MFSGSSWLFCTSALPRKPIMVVEAAEDRDLNHSPARTGRLCGRFGNSLADLLMRESATFAVEGLHRDALWGLIVAHRAVQLYRGQLVS